jgi:hypothetical protein
MTDKPTFVIACRVFEGMLQSRASRAIGGFTFLDYGLHKLPKLMPAAVQEKIDAIQEPSIIILGYGLCGNGLVGLKSREHTLIIPRVDDCIAIFLGSYELYRKEMDEHPGTYYLTRGWLESGTEPLTEYEECRGKFGADKAGLIMDMMLSNYRRMCLVAYSEEELALCRPRALEVAEFCRSRWGLQYEEKIGSDQFIRRLLAASGDVGELLIIPPGGEVTQSQFIRLL